MAQNITISIPPATTSGPALASLLEDNIAAWLTTLSGTTRPVSLGTGGLWIDITNPVLFILNMFDGADDIAIGSFDVTTNVFNVAGGPFVDLLTAQTIAGIKTFSSNPISTATQLVAINALTRKDYVDLLDSANVKLTGAQTVAGAKTFSSIVVMTAAQGVLVNSLTRKDYVDGLAAQHVDLTTAQTIAGAKTFTDNMEILRTTNAEFMVRATLGGFNFRAANSDGSTILFQLSAAGAIEDVWLRAFRDSQVELYFNGSKKIETQIGGARITGQLEISSAAPTAIDQATRKDYVDGLDGGNVKLTGNQTIAGVKTFTNDLVVDRAATNAQIQVRSDLGGGGLYSQNSSGQLRIYQLNAAGGLEDIWILCTRNSAVQLRFDGVAKFATEPTGVRVTGQCEISDAAPTQTDHATRKDYVDGLDGANVKLTGNQTIAGVKTFSSNPISTAAQSGAANSLTRKDYVDGLDGNNVKLTGNQTVAGVKTWTSIVDANAGMNVQGVGTIAALVVGHVNAATVPAIQLSGGDGGDLAVSAGGKMTFGHYDGATFTEDMRINDGDNEIRFHRLLGITTSSGNVMQSPTAALRALDLYANTATAGADVFRVYSDFTGVETNVATIEANGDFLSLSNSYGALSDATLKQDINAAPSTWDDNLLINWVDFRFIADVLENGIDAKVHRGVTAQQLEAIGLNRFVTDREDDDIPLLFIKAVNYSGLYVDQAVTVQEAQQRIEALEASETVFGTEYEYAEVESESTTSSTTFQNKTTLNTAVLPAGDYKITYSAEIRNSSGEESTKARCTIGGVEIGATENETKNGDKWNNFSGVRNMTLTGISEEIKIQFARGTNGTAKIRRARIEIFRVA